MRIIFFLIFLCLGGMAGAQTDFDERLLAKFNKEKIQELEQSNPEVLAYWSYYLDNSYIITDLESGKSYEEFEILSIDDLHNFNILSADVHMERNNPKYYRIEGQNKLLILHSNTKFSSMFNQNRKLNVH